MIADLPLDMQIALWVLAAFALAVVVAYVIAAMFLLARLGGPFGAMLVYPPMPLPPPPPPPPHDFTRPGEVNSYDVDTIVFPSMRCHGRIWYETNVGPPGYRCYLRLGRVGLRHGGKVRTPAWRTPNEDGAKRPA